MILTNRLFVREEPTRDAKSIYIFCEGKEREFNYFMYFKELDSRINIEIYKLESYEDNSPIGLLSIAEKCLVKSETNQNSKYHFLEGDEVWIVLDIDKDRDESRKPQIEAVIEKCNQSNNWYIAQSNPCFEVWLLYHFFPTKITFENSDISKNWKQYLNELIPGGFDSRKHPIYITTASINAERNYSTTDNHPDEGTTNVFNLANSIIPLIKPKLDKVLKDLKQFSS